MTRIPQDPTGLAATHGKNPTRPPRLLVIPDLASIDLVTRSPVRPVNLDVPTMPIVSTTEARPSESPPSSPIEAAPVTGEGTRPVVEPARNVQPARERTERAIALMGSGDLRRWTRSWVALATSTRRRAVATAVVCLTVAYAVLTSFRTVPTPPPTGDILVDHTPDGTVGQIHRMSLAPLRVEPATAHAATAAASGEDQIFQVPKLKSKVADAPAADSASAVGGLASAPAEPAAQSTDAPAAQGARVTPDPDSAVGRMERHETVAGETLVQENLAPNAAASGPSRAFAGEPNSVPPQYETTDPATYRDPEYSVPAIADRRGATNR